MEGLYSLEALWWMVLHHMSVVVLSSCLSYPLSDRTTAVGSSRSCLVFCSWKSDCANLYGPLKYCLSYIQQNKSPRVIFEEANFHFKIGFYQNIGFFEFCVLFFKNFYNENFVELVSKSIFTTETEMNWYLLFEADTYYIITHIICVCNVFIKIKWFGTIHFHQSHLFNCLSMQRSNQPIRAATTQYI